MGSWTFDAAVLWRRRACKYGFEEGDLLFHDPDWREHTETDRVAIGVAAGRARHRQAKDARHVAEARVKRKRGRPADRDDAQEAELQARLARRHEPRALTPDLRGKRLRRAGGPRPFDAGDTHSHDGRDDDAEH